VCEVISSLKISDQGEASPSLGYHNEDVAGSGVSGTTGLDGQLLFLGLVQQVGGWCRTPAQAAPSRLWEVERVDSGLWTSSSSSQVWALRDICCCGLLDDY